MSRKLALGALCCAATMALLLTCSDSQVAGTGSDTPNSAVMGALVFPDGSPAAGASVALVGVGADPRTSPAASAVTDSAGRYAVSRIAAGAYNVLGAKDASRSYRDSVAVAGQDTTNVPTDTLYPVGGVCGVVKLVGQPDTAEAYLLALGTNVWAGTERGSGAFCMSLPQGSYRVRMLTNMAGFGPKDTVLAVRAGESDTLRDTVWINSGVIPVPTGVSVEYDTMRQIVTVRWDRADTALVKGYNVYRRDVDSSFGQTPINGAALVTATVYRDSAGVQDQRYEYKVVAIDRGDNAGNLSAGTSITVITNFVLIDSVPRLRPVDRFAVGPDSLFYGVYIGDSFVRVFNKAGDSVGVIGAGDLVSPTDVAVDSRGRVYAVSTRGINRYAADGTALGHWAIAQPVYLAVDSNDYLYVIYNNGHAVAKEDSTGRLVDSVQVQAAVEIVASSNKTVLVGDGGCQCVHVMDTALTTVRNTEFRIGASTSPNIMAVDAKGRIYMRDIVDFGGQGILEVRIFDVQGAFVAKFQPSKGGDDIRIVGNTIYLVDRNQGLSVYRLPF